MAGSDDYTKRISFPFFKLCFTCLFCRPTTTPFRSDAVDTLLSYLARLSLLVSKVSCEHRRGSAISTDEHFGDRPAPARQLDGEKRVQCSDLFSAEKMYVVFQLTVPTNASAVTGCCGSRSMMMRCEVFKYFPLDEARISRCATGYGSVS